MTNRDPTRVYFENMFFNLKARGCCQGCRSFHLLWRVISQAFSLRVVVSANGLALHVYVYLQLIKIRPSLPCSPCAQQGRAMARVSDPGWQDAWWGWSSS